MQSTAQTTTQPKTQANANAKTKANANAKTKVKTADTKLQIDFIEEDDPFLQLFPHRYDWLYSPYTSPLRKAEWHTETRFPLSDRQIQQGQQFYGVRFAPETTCYAMLDIDIGSPYHPHQDRWAIDRILEILESIELVDYIRIQSSASKGIHIYLPLPKPMPTWKVAEALTSLLEANGYQIQNGVLEVFPNRRTHDNRLYQGHRLPLQQGSYLLDRDYQPTWEMRDQFVHRWRHCQRRSCITEAMLDRVIRQYQRYDYKLSQKATQFLQDLDAQIAPGWTGQGQTNKLLGRIAMRGYVFGHCIRRGDRIQPDTKPLTGDRLIEHIVQTARSLPGFEEFCQHQSDLFKRAKDWIRSIEKSQKYYPYKAKTSDKANKESESNPWNEFQKNTARMRIAIAVADLLERDSLKQGIRDRSLQIAKEYKIGTTTLYKNKDLWHPKEWNQEIYRTKSQDEGIEEPETNPPKPTNSPPNLLVAKGWITFYSKTFQPFIDHSIYTGGKINSDSTQNAVQNIYRIGRELAEKVGFCFRGRLEDWRSEILSSCIELFGSENEIQTSISS